MMARDKGGPAASIARAMLQGARLAIVGAAVLVLWWLWDALAPVLTRPTVPGKVLQFAGIIVAGTVAWLALLLALVMGARRRRG